MGWGRLGIVGYKCEILISESEKLLSEYTRIVGGVEYSFKICGHDFKVSSGNIDCVISFSKEFLLQM